MRASQERIRKGSAAPLGFLGLEILRSFLEKRASNTTALLGAFRGQAVYPVHRLKGMGTWTGPLNIESGSARLRLDQFTAALTELNIVLPESEAKAIFDVMSVNGTLSVSDLIREIRLDPCERSVRWGQQYIYPANLDMPSSIVKPTISSGYTNGPHRARPKSAAVTRAEVRKLKEEWTGRVAPTRTSGYITSVPQANWMSQDYREDRSKSGLPEADDGSMAAMMYKTNPFRIPAASGLLHTVKDDPDRFLRDGIGRRIVPPIENTCRAAPAEGSGEFRERYSSQLSLSSPLALTPTMAPIFTPDLLSPHLYRYHLPARIPAWEARHMVMSYPSPLVDHFCNYFECTGCVQGTLEIKIRSNWVPTGPTSLPSQKCGEWLMSAIRG